MRHPLPSRRLEGALWVIAVTGFLALYVLSWWLLLELG